MVAKEITIKSISEKYLAHHNLILKGGDYVAPLMCFLLMDIQYQIYFNKIRPLDLKHELKRYRKFWSDAYNRFNGEFFGLFDKDEQAFITDIMDRCSSYVNNEVVMLHCGVMNLLDFTEFKERDIRSSMLMCNFLTQMASTFWEISHRSKFGVVPENLDLSVIAKNSYQLANKWHALDRNISLNDENISKLVDNLIRKVVNFCVNNGK